jgi:hypothetical protein
LHKYAYPDWYRRHQDKGQKLQDGFSHGAGSARCLQLRGEYLYVAEGSAGVRVYDVANVSNKGVSQRMVTAPFSALGHDTRVASSNATCIALPSNQPIDPARNVGDKMRIDNQEQPMHAQYNYAFVTDAKEGLILININTLADGEPRNNRLQRALTWNPGGVLNGVEHLTIGGNYIYAITPRGLVVVGIDDPLKPTVVAQLPLNKPRASALQFRYLFVTTADGLQSVDVTNPAAPRAVGNAIAIRDAHRVYVARTYAYVAAGAEGIVIVDVERPDATREYQRFNAGGKLTDSRDVIVASTNASAFAYVADGNGGLKVLQLTSPDSQPKFYGFSPAPKPQLIAHYPTSKAALALSKGLDRDRGVDESGNQIAVFGRRGSRPFNLAEMRKLFLDTNGQPWYVPSTQKRQ